MIKLKDYSRTVALFCFHSSMGCLHSITWTLIDTVLLQQALKCQQNKAQCRDVRDLISDIKALLQQVKKFTGSRPAMVRGRTCMLTVQFQALKNHPLHDLLLLERSLLHMSPRPQVIRLYHNSLTTGTTNVEFLSHCYYQIYNFRYT